MSYRELRNFCEIMRGLGFGRLISIENFRKPNFELVAEILFWLAQRFDPQADISDDIEEERNRVEFIKSIATLFATKTRIKLNTKKLYASDGQAVQEILKVATILYKAYNQPPSEEEASQAFQLPSKLSNLKQHKQTANEITEIGARLFDYLQKENEVKQHRDKALQFLDNISRNLESNTEQQYIEKCVREIVQQQDENIQEMQKFVGNLENDQRVLDEKIRKKTLDLNRAQQRLDLLAKMQPPHMKEYEMLEHELEQQYELYIQKFRNLDYLENQLDIYNKEEEKKFVESQQLIQRRWEKLKVDEIRQLQGEQEIDENLLEQQMANPSSRGQSRGDSRGLQNKPGSQQSKDKQKMSQQQGFMQKNNIQGNLQGPQEEEEESGGSLGEQEEQGKEGSNPELADSAEDGEEDQQEVSGSDNENF